MREAMRMILEGEGFSVDEAPDAAAALEALRGDLPALVFLDLNIPGGPGLDVLAAMKTDRATSTIPVIVITAEGEESRAAAIDAGAIDYLTKPFGPHALLRAVERALGGSSSPGG